MRLEAEMLRGEWLAGARKAGLHFVGDEENAVFAADILEQLEVLARRNDEATFPENGLEDYGGDGFWSRGTLESIFQVMREGFRRGAFFAPGRIGERNLGDIAGKGLEAGFVGMGLAGQRHGKKGAAM